MSDIGHYSWLTGRLSRLHAVQASRGMSAAALARLPQPPATYNEPLPVRTVLATKRDAIRYDLQAKMLKVQHERGAAGRFKPSPYAKTRSLTWEKDPQRHNRLQRMNAIIEIVAKAGGVEGYQIRQKDARKRFTIPRSLAIHLVRKLVEPPVYVIADAMGYSDVSTPRFHASKVRRRLEFGHQAVVEIHDRAMAEIVKRWPEYAT